jgi:hypothetical protein
MLMKQESFDTLIKAVAMMAVNVKSYTFPRDKIADQLVLLVGVLTTMRDRHLDLIKPPDAPELLRDKRSRDIMEAVIANMMKGH